MKRLSLYFFPALLAIAFSCSNPPKETALDAPGNLHKYKLMEDGVGITVNRDHPVGMEITPIEKFNRGGKRGRTIMVTGDLPCFAQMRTNPEKDLNPSLIKLGDGRIRISYDSRTCYLDSIKEVETLFYPGITRYHIKMPGAEDLVFDLTVFHAGTWGIAAKLEVSNFGKEAKNVGIEFIYGGLRKCGRTSDAAYFRYDNEAEKGNSIEITGGSALISDASIGDMVGVTTLPEVNPVVSKNRVHFTREFSLNATGGEEFYLITTYNEDRTDIISKLETEDPDEILSENERYYDELLSEAVISTPNELIDGGFRTALVNLDNVFTDSAWLEGVHWWASYFTNLFQISAAISLDQRERARNALTFYNTAEFGPAPAIRQDQSPEPGTEDDGLDYYIYALMQYVDLTGDTQFLAHVWQDVMNALRRIMMQKDPDGDHLLYWQFGCNIFLYQADLLGMPGKATSPSIMTYGMMERLSDYARMLGRREDAEWLIETSSEIKAAVMSSLWNSDEGCFYNHIDLQDIPHMAHYYTDHIFSTLYASYDPMINWQCLNYLRKSLIEINFEGKPSLMRVGNLQGSLFGNDNVMPTQMAETARAFYKIGDKKQATSFLESVARAGTIYTDAPGNFPERMSDIGKGESNYLFGNPIGSFLYAVVDGLFGMEIADRGQTLRWEPGFPESWGHASLQLPYAKVQYRLHSGISGSKATYVAEHSSERGLRFSVFLPPCEIQNLTCNGNKVDYTLHPGLNRIKLTMMADPALSHELELRYRIISPHEMSEMTVVGSGLNRLPFNQHISDVDDPQDILQEVDFEKNILKFRTRERSGEHTVFVKLRAPAFYVPLKLNIVPDLDIRCDTAYYDISDHTLLVRSKLFIAKDEGCKYTIDASVSGMHRVISVDSNLHDTVEFVFEDFPLPVKLIENVRFVVENTNGTRSEMNERVILTGIDEISVKAISRQRMKSLRSIDISSLLNANSYLSVFPWGVGEQSVNLLIAKNGAPLHTRFGSFISPPANHSMLLIELGRSDLGTRITIPTQYSTSVEIPVGLRVSELDLLYLSEVESRNTGTRVGRIAMIYANNDSIFLPLVVGRNMDFFKCYTAREAFPIFFSEDLDRITSYSARDLYNKCCNKHLNLLPILCDSSKILKSIQISMEAADAQFGLVGINYLE